MRYILNSEGYIFDVSFGAEIECSLGTCTEYKGKVPDGYETIEEWFSGESERLNAWKIVDGDLVFDENRAYKLKILYEQQSNENSHVTRKEMGMASTEEINPYTDLYPSQQSAGGYITSLDGTFNKVGNLPTEEVNLSLMEEQDLDLIELEFIGDNFLPNTATSSVNNGIEYTQNKDKTINISGTATDRSTLNLAGTDTSVRNILTFKGLFDVVNDAGETIKRKTNYLLFGLADGVSLEFYKYDGSDRTLIGIYNGGIISFEKDTNVTQVVLVVDKGTIIDATIKPMLQLVNLDYPILPMTKYKGNLFNASLISNTDIVVSDNGATITLPVVTAGNGYTSTETKLKTLCPELKVGDVATLSFTRNLGNNYNNFIYVAGELWGNKKSLTITQEMLDANVIMYGNRFKNGETEQVILTNFQIEKGTSISEFKEYNGRDGQYYVDGVSIQETNTPIEQYDSPKNKKGYINSTGTEVSNNNWYTSDYIELDNTLNTYSGISTSGNAPYSAYYDSSKAYISSFKQATGTNILTDIPQNAKYVRFSINEGDITSFSFIAGCNSPSPDYPSEIVNLYKAGTYNLAINNKIFEITIPQDLKGLPNGIGDRLWFDIDGTGRIDIEEKVGSIVFDGSDDETWAVAYSGTSNYFYRYRYLTDRLATSKNDYLSNNYSYANIGSTNTVEGINITINNEVRIRYGTEDTLENFKVWLSENNVKVQYELSEYTTSSIDGYFSNEYEYEEYKNNTTLIDLAGNEFTTSDKITIKDNQIILIKGDKEIFLGDTVMPRTYTPYTHAYCHQRVYIDFKYKDPRNVDITKINLKGLLSITDIETEYNFTLEDAEKVLSYVNGEIDLTDDELEFYDVNADGVVDKLDYLAIQRMYYGYISNIVKGTLEINSTKAQRTIVLRDEEGKIQTSLGLNGITTPSLSCDNFYLGNAPIIESGSNDNGSYVKYADGTMICRAKKNIVTGTWGATGSMYYYDFSEPISFPEEFLDEDTLSVEISSNNSSFVFLCQGVSYTASEITKVNLLRPTLANNSSITISYIAIGKWKE